MVVSTLMISVSDHQIYAGMTPGAIGIRGGPSNDRGKHDFYGALHHMTWKQSVLVTFHFTLTSNSENVATIAARLYVNL